MTDTGLTLFDAVVRSVTLDGECEDEVSVGAFSDWLQETGCDVTLELPTAGFVLNVKRDGRVRLTGQWDQYSRRFGDYGPKSGFREWLCRSIGFDCSLDWK